MVTVRLEGCSLRRLGITITDVDGVLGFDAVDVALEGVDSLNR